MENQKIRIFKKPDGRAILNYVAAKYTNDLENCRIPPDLEGLPYVVVSREDIASLEIEYVEQLYIDGDCKKENLKKDIGWENCLMSWSTIRKKHLDNINAKLDTELDNEQPDPVTVLKLQRQKEKCASFSQKDWYQQAIENLDNRVQNGEPDKPVVRQKLLSRIQD